MLERRDPFSRMLSLRQMMDRLMEDAFVMPRDALMSGIGALAGGGQMDVYEEGNDFVVEAQLPGFKPEDIDISVERGTLTIRGELRGQEERKDRNYLIREQRPGSFQRTIQLPQTVNPDACQATFEHGILRLTFPRAEQAQPRRIPISVGGAGGALGASGGASATTGRASSGQTSTGSGGSARAANESTGMGGAAGDGGSAGGSGGSTSSSGSTSGAASGSGPGAPGSGDAPGSGSPATPESQAKTTAQ